MHKMNTQRVYGRLVHRLAIALISMTVTFIALLVATVGPGSHTTIEAAGKVTIRYTYWGGQEEQEAVAELVRLFQARNPDIEHARTGALVSSPLGCVRQPSDPSPQRPGVRRDDELRTDRPAHPPVESSSVADRNDHAGRAAG